LRAVVLDAWKTLHRIRRDQLSMLELPLASLQALTANINRDPKKGKPFTALDFAMFQRKEENEKPLAPEVAATAMALRAERMDAPILLAAWDKVLASVSTDAKPPAIRALRSDDAAVWLLCPSWEGRNIRAGLIAVGDAVQGTVKLRDVDRPLATYSVEVPDRRTFAWLETGLLLVAAPEN